MGDERSSTQSNVKLSLWLTFVAFLIIIAVFHSKISEISLGEKGVSAKMISPQDVNSLSPQERQSAQQEIGQRAKQLEQQIKSPPPSAPPTDAQSETQFNSATYQQPSAESNIAGYWHDIYGSVFTIQQTGTYIALYGYSNNMLYLVGSGQFGGSTLSLQTYNLAGRYGTMMVQVSPDGRQLNGTYTDTGSAQSWAIQISR